MSDVPVGIARLLSRAVQPALSVGRLAGFTALAPVAETVPDAATPLSAATTRARPAPATRVASTSSRAAVGAPTDDGLPTQREPEAHALPVAPAAEARVTVPVEIDELTDRAYGVEPAASIPRDAVVGTLPVPEETERRSVVASRSTGNDASAVRRAIDDADPSRGSAGSQHAAQPAAALLEPPSVRVAVEQSAHAASRARPAGDTEATAASPPPPVVIGQIAVHVTNPEPPADPFAGCRALADGLTAKRGGGW